MTENQATIQIRHAYGEIYDDSFSLLAGQTWDLVSPLQPHTVNYSIGWGGGNIGFRRMQVRYTRNLNFSDYLQMTPAVAACENIIVDGPVNDRETTDWPVIEGRLGWTLGPRGDGCKPIAFGMSGHIGEQGFDFARVAGPIVLPAGENNRIRTWSVNADVLVPITERITFQGEFFTGADLATFLGGVVQGVDFTRREAIHSTGGWMELGFDWRKDLHTYVGYGIDDPRNSDIVGEPSATLRTGRTYNHFLFANVMYDMTEKMKFGLEVSSWKTKWLDLEPGNAVVFEFAGQYGF